MTRFGGRRSLNFAGVISGHVGALATKGEPVTSLHTEPTEPILLLGLMADDTVVIAEKLGALTQARDSYRGELYVILGAARRIGDRATFLLNDKE